MTTYTVFEHQGRWVASVPTAAGFRHVRLGTLNSLNSKAKAEERAEELLKEEA